MVDTSLKMRGPSASPYGGSWPHLMVGLDELAHLMVASLQRSWCNRVSSYDGHELRVLRLRLSCAYPALILRCSLRVLSHFLSPFL